MKRTDHGRITGKKIGEMFSVALAIGILYTGYHFLGISCPIKFLTGISCAGCGMTRAWIALLHLDPGAAFAYHPLFWLPPLAVCVYLCRDRLGQNTYRFCFLTFGLLFVIVYMVRLISPANDIVVFRPRDGMAIKLLKYIYKGGQYVLSKMWY